MAEFTTPNGKQISTFIEPGTAMIRIKFNTGGELPVELSGMFTSLRVAHQTIEGYIQQVTDTPKRTVRGQ
jgi:hypothetical protein